MNSRLFIILLKFLFNRVFDKFGILTEKVILTLRSNFMVRCFAPLVFSMLKMISFLILPITDFIFILKVSFLARKKNKEIIVSKFRHFVYSFK